jgi:multidrug resistance efflux pump
MKKARRFLIPVGFILIIIFVVVWYLTQIGEQSEDGPLQASGTVETIEVVVSPESAGKVADVRVREGEGVRVGDVLVTFEDVLLINQFDQAKAALEQVRANYDLIAAQPLNEQRQVAITAAQLELLSAQQDLQNLIDNADVARAHALQAVEEAQDEIDALDENFALEKAAAHQAITVAEGKVKTAKHRLYYFTIPLSQAELDTFDAISLTEAALDQAREAYQPYKFEEIDYDKVDCKNATVSNRFPEICGKQTTREEIRDAVEDAEGDYSTAILRLELEDNLAFAEAELEKANSYYDSLGETPSEADKALLESKLAEAIRELEAYKDGPDPDDIALAEARVRSADANLSLALVDTSQEQLNLAQAQVDAAQATLDILQTQIDKLVLMAPIDGIVLYRSVEIGEVVQPGSSAMTIGDLENLTITVFIPEDEYGRINIGGQASVSVDSFPGRSYEAEVVRISDRAEFTPRNVQTEEGRRTTVFAVELSVFDPTGELKPGMPADVIFEE